MSGVRKSAQLRPMIEFIGAFGIALVLFLGGNYVARHQCHPTQGAGSLGAGNPNWAAEHPGKAIPNASSFPIPNDGGT